MNKPVADLPSPTASRAKIQTKVVACLGASMTEAKGSFNWIQALEQRPENAVFQFHNLGRGGDLAFNALRRLPSVIACHPDVVIVLIGTNDILALISPAYRSFARRFKHIDAMPSPEWYCENLQEIVRRLKRETQAQVALISLPPIGEAPQSTDPFQTELNRRVAEYDSLIQSVAASEGASYIPFYERLQPEIGKLPGKAVTGFRFLPFYRNAFRQFVLHQSLDEIARHNGRQFYVDGIHLTSRSGKILVEIVQDYLDTLT